MIWHERQGQRHGAGVRAMPHTHTSLNEIAGLHEEIVNTTRVRYSHHHRSASINGSGTEQDNLEGFHNGLQTSEVMLVLVLHDYVTRQRFPPKHYVITQAAGNPQINEYSTLIPSPGT